MLQRHAIEKFHDDEGLMFLLADFINRADVGMVQGGGRLRLALKAGQGLRILDHIAGKKLKRDKPVQRQVFGFVDNTHPAAAEFFEDAIV